MNTFKRRKIGEILVDRGELNTSDLSFVLALIKSTGERFGKVCLVNALVSEEALARALAEQFGMEYVDLKGFKMDEAILEIFPHVLPKDTIYRFHFVPLESCGDCLIVAVDDPTDILKLDELEFLLHKPVIFKLATESAIEAVLQREEGSGWIFKDTAELKENGGFCGVKIPVSSLKKSMNFYRDFLGLGVKKQSQDLVVFEHGLVLVNAHYRACLPKDLKLRSLVYIETSDIEGRFSRAIKHNIRIVSKLAQWGESGKLFFRCLDPDGNVVEVIPQ
ncbi:MAG TPA: VOC family protein [Geobacteraceae bacterium]|nr:VOC family protein [Geobacteraceae bacterium]